MTTPELQARPDGGAVKTEIGQRALRSAIAVNRIRVDPHEPLFSGRWIPSPGMECPQNADQHLSRATCQSSPAYPLLRGEDEGGPLAGRAALVLHERTEEPGNERTL